MYNLTVVIKNYKSIFNPATPCNYSLYLGNSLYLRLFIIYSTCYEQPPVSGGQSKFCRLEDYIAVKNKS